MRTRTLLIVSLLLASAAVQAGENKTDNSLDAKAAFDRLATLVGDWQADTSMGKARASYELIAGGTALVERESAEHMPAMMTVYYVDGGRLLLTHYCMVGNQPRMQARSFDPATGLVRFEFLDATNLASKDAGHMHNATIRVADNGHLSTEWEFYEGGQRKNAESAQYTRVQ